MQVELCRRERRLLVRKALAVEQAAVLALGVYTPRGVQGHHAAR